MNLRMILISTFLCAALLASARPQMPSDDPDVLLKQAFHYGDLYNWADAAPMFTEAEQLYSARGDNRNALYAHLGRIRSTMEQLTLPEVSEELGAELDKNPLLQSDKQLRLFCLMVLGDIDGEIDAAPMRRDWEAALKLAQELGDKKLENRASGELGFALFLEGDMTPARQKVAGALMGAMMLGDIGAQIRYLGAVGYAYMHLGSYDDALGYFDKALKIAAANPDAGYQFVVNEGRLQAFRGMGKLDAAEQLANEIIAEARARKKHVKETQALITAGTVENAKGEEAKAIGDFETAIDLSEKGHFPRLLADAQFYLEDIYRKKGDLPKAESLATAAADSTQNSGDLYLLPVRLQSLAQLQASQGKYSEASQTYDRASDVLDAMIGNVRSAAGKIGLVNAMSSIYVDHFSLVADHLNDPAKAFSVVEHARGRVTTELLMSGKPPESQEELEIEKQISRLNLELAKAKSTEQVRQIRDKIFLAEEARWVTPASGTWKSQPGQTIPLERVRDSVAPNELVLEYVMAQPHSYCLAISRDFARIVQLADRESIEGSITTYLKTLKTKGVSKPQGANLYAALLKEIPEVSKKERLTIVPDGRLHLLPFDALVDGAGGYLVSSHTITYAASATSLYLLNSAQHQPVHHALLGIGGIPYEQNAELTKLATLRGYISSPLVDLPASKEEVLAAQAAFRSDSDTVLLGSSATKSAFERSGLEQHSIIHLAVHGVANEKHPERAALILLSDSTSGDDGVLEASDIVHLHTSADLIVLSACDTAVGRLQGEEGIANLSLAFQLAGAKTVVSTLWTIEDTTALYLMKRFYAHLAEKDTVAHALTAAKRDMLKTYGTQAVPYYWASFKVEGAGDQPVSITESATKN
ncbi:MAG TPA: CHAT domain-containing protein [Candidatus Acidoferrum sp.]|nr:CHAT domain-containing protein [Candidatus Acidoferrum sp.]